MNKIRTLALLVLAGAVFPLWAQEPADEPVPPPQQERIRKGPHGKKGPRQDRPAGKRRPAPMMAERLAAEFPKEFAEIENLRTSDPAPAHPKGTASGGGSPRSTDHRKRSDSLRNLPGRCDKRSRTTNHLPGNSPVSRIL